MKLNDIQLEYLVKINKGLESNDRLKDIYTFFEYFCKIKKEEKSCPQIIYNNTSDINFVKPSIYDVENNYCNATLSLSNHSVIFENSEKIFYDTLYFLELWEFLEKNKLITIIEKEPNALKDFKVPLLDKTYSVGVNEYNQIDDKLWLLVKDYVLLEIVPLTVLNDFIVEGYKTKKEIILEKEIQDRNDQLIISKKSLKRNTIISFSALFISFFIGFLNFLSYNTERSITIVGDSTKNDTNKVIILNNNQFDNDTKRKIDTLFKK